MRESISILLKHKKNRLEKIEAVLFIYQPMLSNSMSLRGRTCSSSEAIFLLYQRLLRRKTKSAARNDINFFIMAVYLK
jgi:hypothetical protein